MQNSEIFELIGSQSSILATIKSAHATSY